MFRKMSQEKRGKVLGWTFITIPIVVFMLVFCYILGPILMLKFIAALTVFLAWVASIFIGILFLSGELK